MSLPEIWGTKLTIGLIPVEVDEHGLLNVAELKEIDPDQRRCRSGLSAPSSCGWRNRCPIAWRSCSRPAAAESAHGRLQARPHAVDGLRNRRSGSSPSSENSGIDLLLGDSTNAERPASPAERLVGSLPVTSSGREAASGRLLRIELAPQQKVVNVAAEAGRKVAVVGRSMRKNMNISRKLGYLDAPDTHHRPRSSSTWAARALISAPAARASRMSALTRSRTTTTPRSSSNAGTP